MIGCAPPAAWPFAHCSVYSYAARATPTAATAATGPDQVNALLMTRSSFQRARDHVLLWHADVLKNQRGVRAQAMTHLVEHVWVVRQKHSTATTRPRRKPGQGPRPTVCGRADRNPCWTGSTPRSLAPPPRLPS